MDDISIRRVLAANVQDLKRGVRLTKTDSHSLNSNTFICFLTFDETLRFGYFYQNGSNGRLVYSDQKEVKRGTIPRGTLVIAFGDVTVDLAVDSDKFTQRQLLPKWFDKKGQDLVLQELKALLVEQDEVAKLIRLLQGLGIDQVRDVIHYMESL